MTKYLVSFFTHYDAIKCKRLMRELSVEVTLSPVPRALSSSCGTCANFQCDFDPVPVLEDDFEQLFLVETDKYVLIANNT